MGESLPSRIQYWLTEAKHDCFFVVGLENGQTERIGAMKTFLMGHSEPFRAMLQDSNLAEKGDIRVPDVEPETFWNFLKCVYGANNFVISKLPFEECAKLLYIAEKYLADDIKTEVYVRLNSLFSCQEIFLALSHPVCYQNEKLKNKLLSFLIVNAEKIMMDERFLGIQEFAVVFILQALNSSLITEVTIWKAILRWTKHKSNSTDGKVLRSYMLNFLKFIRFLTMDCNDFCAEVVPSGVLHKNEVYEICKSLGTGKPHNLEHLCRSTQSRDGNAIQPKEQRNTSFIPFQKCVFIQCSVSKISDMRTPSRVFIKFYPWAGYLWCVNMSKTQFSNKDYVNVRVASLYDVPRESFPAQVKVNLINQSGKPDVCKITTSGFTTTQHEPYLAYWWCFRLFLCPWDTLVDPQEGFVIDDSIIFTIQIQLLNS